MEPSVDPSNEKLVDCILSDNISKKMESLSITNTQRVVRRDHSYHPSRYSPYTSRARVRVTFCEKHKEEVVRIGVELSVLVAKAMFLLSDDVRSVLCLCFLIFKRTGNQRGPVVKRLVSVMEHVFETYIKPKNGVYKDGGKMPHWELISKLQQSFCLGFTRLDSVLKIGGVMNLSTVERHNLEDMLKSVTEANRFPREDIETNVLHVWKDLFDSLNPSTTAFKRLRLELDKLREIFSKSNNDILEASEVVKEALECNIPKLWKSFCDTKPQVINNTRITTFPEFFSPLVEECKRCNVFVRELGSLRI